MNEIPESDWWNLDQTYSKFILPRLRRYRESFCGTPYSKDKDDYLEPDEWAEVLDKMIFAFEYDLCLFDYKSPDEISDEDLKKNYERAKEGMKLFGEYYFDLWD